MSESAEAPQGPAWGAQEGRNIIARQIDVAKGKALRQKVGIVTAVRDINEDIRAKHNVW